MQLIAGRTAQEYNQRKNRQGAFREDRYHATAIEADEHLHRCLVYIDLNRVRAGAVNHPEKWKGAVSACFLARNDSLFIHSQVFSSSEDVPLISDVQPICSQIPGRNFSGTLSCFRNCENMKAAPSLIRVTRSAAIAVIPTRFSPW
jgi:hypothetical protein